MNSSSSANRARPSVGQEVRGDFLHVVRPDYSRVNGNRLAAILIMA
jgi:hypothetical protein